MKFVITLIVCALATPSFAIMAKPTVSIQEWECQPIGNVPVGGPKTALKVTIRSHMGHEIDRNYAVITTPVKPGSKSTVNPMTYNEKKDFYITKDGTYAAKADGDDAALSKRFGDKLKAIAWCSKNL